MTASEKEEPPSTASEAAGVGVDNVPAAVFAPLIIEQLSIHNFRGMDCEQIHLEPDVTVILGPNNSGKSRILRALGIAVGAVAVDADDLTLPKLESAEIRVVVAPVRRQGTTDEEFDTGIRRRLAGIDTISEDPIRERIAWQTIISGSSEGVGARVDRYWLRRDQTTDTWTPTLNRVRLSELLISGDLIETQRDIASELNRRNSPIRRIFGDLEIKSDVRESLEERLRSLGNDISHASDSMGAVVEALSALTRLVETIGRPSLSPLPMSLEEVARSISIDLDSGAGRLPMRLHGSGARSLSSLQVQSILYDRRVGKDGPEIRSHPLSLVEEPEAHLHPQAQFELYPLLSSISGQVLVSSHSTHLATVAEPRQLRVIRSQGDVVRLIDLHPTDDSAALRARRPSMHVEEMEKIRRLVERPFGELLFASAVIVVDGATERALLPPIIRYAMGNRASGVCVVDPGSMGTDLATAVVKFCNLIELPWILFSDCDSSGKSASEKLVADQGDQDMRHVVWVSGDETASGRNGDDLETMMIGFDPAVCEVAATTLGYVAPANLNKFMSSKKGAIGRLLAEEFLRRYPKGTAESGFTAWPASFQRLLSELERQLPA